MARYNKDALKAEIVRNGFNLEKVGEQIGLARATVYKRFSNGSWTLDDCKNLAELLHLNGKDINRIFFA